jgi:hypothetical protein
MPEQKIAWKRPVIEGVVIVASILLAFGIEAWWNETQERAGEQQLLVVLERDMERSRSDLERVLSTNERTTEALRRFMALTPETLAGLPADSAETLLVDLAALGTFTPFDGALKSPDLSIIDDVPTLAALGSWLGLSADVVEDNPYLLEGLRETLRFVVSSEAFSRYLGVESATGWPSGASTLGRLRRDDSFLAARLIHQEAIMVNQAKVRGLLEYTDEVIRLIQGQRH